MILPKSSRFLTIFLAPTLLLSGPSIEARTARKQAKPPVPVTTPVAPVQTVQARPALWVAKDKDTTIYLFGTIHLLKPNLVWFEGPIRKAFDDAGQVVV